MALGGFRRTSGAHCVKAYGGDSRAMPQPRKKILSYFRRYGNFFRDAYRFLLREFLAVRSWFSLVLPCRAVELVIWDESTNEVSDEVTLSNHFGTGATSLNQVMGF